MIFEQLQKAITKSNPQDIYCRRKFVANIEPLLTVITWESTTISFKHATKRFRTFALLLLWKVKFVANNAFSRT